MKKSVLVSVLAVSAGMVTTIQAATVTINSWNVGAGQPKTNFLLNSSSNFGIEGGVLELGLRTINRQSALDVAVVGETYTVHNGYQTAGEYGAPVTNMARNRWNFDYHIYSSAGFDNLNVFMTIIAPNGNTVTAPAFDMELMANDNLLPGNGDSQDPSFYIQDSQNPVFGWFQNFDMNVVGTYTFALTAYSGTDSLCQTMYVNVIPAPAAVGPGLAGLGLIVFRRRRRAVTA